MNKVRTRFAPSPTGDLHVGGLRTAAYAYAHAKKNGGEFLLRIEDTDKNREVEGARERLKSVLTTFGIHWDEYYVQSERAAQNIYRDMALKLVSDGHAFYCQCDAKNAKKEGYSTVLRDPCRDKGYSSGAIKLRVPDNERISYHDLVFKKEVSWSTNDVADTTLLKSDGILPTYHLAVVVDDHAMEISHVFRGHDWLPSTPIHLLVYKYLGYALPEIGHLTDIQDIEGGKLSKRKGSFSCEALLAEGFLPEAIFNFIILLGWAPKDNREHFTLSEFVEAFDLSGLQKTNPVYNIQKLEWFNAHYIRQKNDIELEHLFDAYVSDDYDKSVLSKIIPLVKERVKKLSDFSELSAFFFVMPTVDRASLSVAHQDHLAAAREALSSVTDWTVDALNTVLLNACDSKQYKRSDFFMDLRIAITGKKVSPPLNDSMSILGKEKCLERISQLL